MQDPMKMAFRAVVGLLALYAVVAVNGQQCDLAVRDFHDCMRQNHKGGSGEKKAQVAKCLTDNGCVAPQDGPSGGRAGRQCFEAVHEKMRDAVQQCVRRTVPNFTAPQKLPEGFGHSGESHSHEDHGPGGFPGGPPPGGPREMLERLRSACNNDATKISGVQRCVASVFIPNQDMRKKFDDICSAKKTCEAKLTTTCKDEMKNVGKALCGCREELKSKFQELAQKEPSCSGVTLPQKGPFGGHDCSQTPTDPCQGTFDDFVKALQNRGPRPGGQ